MTATTIAHTTQDETGWFLDRGWFVLRFWDDYVLNETDETLGLIKLALRDRDSVPDPLNRE